MNYRRTLALTLLCALAGTQGCTSRVTDDTDAGLDAGGHDAAPGVDAATVPDAALRDANDHDANEPDAYVAPDANVGPDSGLPCTTSTDCQLGYYCHTPDGMCDGPGVCELSDPSRFCAGADFVCGCDGYDYVNPCAARRRGVAIDHAGTCDGSAGCTNDLMCPSTGGLFGARFCQYPDGACGGTGVCTPQGRGLLCTNHCVPQCGCDGVSYRNECDRRQHATSLSQPEECPGGPAVCSRPGACCTSGADCALGQVCVPSTDDPTSSRCEPIPPAPGCWQDRDCGGTLHCVGAFVCPCALDCPTPTTHGTCQ